MKIKNVDFYSLEAMAYPNVCRAAIFRTAIQWVTVFGPANACKMMKDAMRTEAHHAVDAVKRNKLRQQVRQKAAA